MHVIGVTIQVQLMSNTFSILINLPGAQWPGLEQPGCNSWLCSIPEGDNYAGKNRVRAFLKNKSSKKWTINQQFPRCLDSQNGQK